MAIMPGEALVGGLVILAAVSHWWLGSMIKKLPKKPKGVVREIHTRVEIRYIPDPDSPKICRKCEGQI